MLALAPFIGASSAQRAAARAAEFVLAGDALEDDILSLRTRGWVTDLPVGLEIDGPLGSDDRLIGIGLSIEATLGALPAPTL